MLLRHTQQYSSAMQALALFGLMDSTDGNFAEVRDVVGGIADRLHGLADELFVQPYEDAADASEEDTPDIKLVGGRKYRIKSMIPGVQRVPRYHVLKFVDIDSRTGDYIWNARPLAGTQAMSRESTISIEDVDQDTKLYMNRRVKDR